MRIKKAIYVLLGMLILLSSFWLSDRISSREVTGTFYQLEVSSSNQSNEIGENASKTDLKQKNINEEENAELKKVAITFDDGPHPEYTSELLDGLKERGVQATFFVTGEHAEEYPELIRRISDEGHLLGNHTYSHLQLSNGNREVFKEELVKTSDLLYDITGKKVQYVRPPYGTWDKTFEKELNMFPVLWDVDPLDWCSSDAACVTQRVLAKVEENSIILLHDSYPSTVTAAFNIIDTLQAEGYEFVTVEEILFD